MPLYRCSYNFVSIKSAGRHAVRTPSTFAPVTPCMHGNVSVRLVCSQNEHGLGPYRTLELAHFRADAYGLSRANTGSTHRVDNANTSFLLGQSAWPQYGQYCKFQLVKYKAWIVEPAQAWDGTSLIVIKST